MIKYDNNNILNWKVNNGDIVKTYYHNIPCFQKAVAPSFKWITLSAGDTIPKCDVYGVVLDAMDVSANEVRIGSDINNCALFNDNPPTRAPAFYSYYYTVENGNRTLEYQWENGTKEFIFADYHGAEYYHEDGTKTAPCSMQLYIYS